jgi:putative ABC transport system permease protein
MSDFRKRFRTFLSKPPVEDEVESEISLHLELLTRRYLDQGLTPQQARAKALNRFGDVVGTRDECRQIAVKRDREMSFLQWLAEFRLDAKQAVHQMFRQKSFTLAAISTIALGLAATTVAFSFLHAVVLKPLPIPQPDRVMRVLTVENGEPGTTSTGAFGGWVQRTRSFEALAAVAGEGYTLVDGQGATRLNGATVTSGFFAVFGHRLPLGRFFSEEESKPGGPRLAMISNRLWTSRFQSDPAMVGRIINLNADGYTVIGVLPEAFETLMPGQDILMPLRLTPRDLHHFGGSYLRVFGRLKPGVSVEAANAEMVAVSRQLDERFAGSRAANSARVTPFSEEFSGKYKGRLFILFGAVGLVLLIACSNVANLLLAKGATRERELAVRAALGAGRGRLVRQLLTESLMLALGASLLGLVLAREALLVLVAVSPADLPRLNEVSLDGPTTAFALVLGVLSSLVFGAVPALRAAGVDILMALQNGNRSSTAGGSADRMRGVLIAAEVSLSLVLLAGAAQLIGGAIRLSQTSVGYEPAGVIAAQMALPATGYRQATKIANTYGQILRNVKALPGVQMAALGSRVPLEGPSLGGQFVREGQTLNPANALRSRMNLVSPGYFRTLRIPLSSGRDFDEHDTETSPRVMLINQTLARRMARDGAVLGARLQPDISDFRRPDGVMPGIEVIGVVSDFRDGAPWEDPEPTLYLPITQTPAGPWEWLGRELFVVARTPGRAEDLVTGLRSALAAVDPLLPVFEAHTVQYRLDKTTAAIRLNTIVFTGLGFIGLVLAAMGIYGVVSHFVAQQTREIGVRLALGASVASVLKLVIGRGMKPVAAGILAGILAAAALSRLIESHLPGVIPNDNIAIALAVPGFSLIAFLACYIPAQRASAVDPVVALREL